jgi:hydrogenase maturation protein HypF
MTERLNMSSFRTSEPSGERDPESRQRSSAGIEAHRFVLGGRVQGVGFRPFVHRLAAQHALNGWVRNRVGEVEIHAQGEPAALAAFAHALVHEAPPLARPALLSHAAATPQALEGFGILPSTAATQPRIHVPPDYFCCDDCLREFGDPRDRRHRYPFINCTQCGPRYTLIARLPYDRPNTTMAEFALCPECRREYENPSDRRFHAEPVACPVCGPRLSFTEPLRDLHRSPLPQGEGEGQGEGFVPESDHPPHPSPLPEGEGDTFGTPRALAHAVRALCAGQIVAVKGIGGYHLMCNARNDQAVARLRAHKPRPDKPLAVLVPRRGADGLDAVRAIAVPTQAEAKLLTDPSRPIVLLVKRADSPLSPLIAPGLAEVGVFLPYSPLHHLLLEDFGGPLVATSANVSGEPVLTDNADVERRLSHVADAFLHHDRPIARPADDAVYRLIAGAPRPIRLGRGGAPLELELPFTLDEPLLAVGGHMKNTVALAWDQRCVISPHIGDLDAPRSIQVFEQVIADLQHLYGVRAQRIVHDAHTGYASTRFAKRRGLPAAAVFHHHAHASALAGEYPEVKRWLAFTWDGVGYGADGTLWGGEALLGNAGAWQRVASFRPFSLPGGEKAGREPWRSALALCWETGLEWRHSPEETPLLLEAWHKRINAPQSSAVGRLFDAAAALTGVNLKSSFEGQGPMLFEALAEHDAEPIALPLARDAQNVWRSDWAPLLPMLMDESLGAGERADTFHASLAHALVAQTTRLRSEHGTFTVGLSGGVFQNRRLAEKALAALTAAGFETRLPLQLPCNDAGLSFGQIIEARRLFS